MADGPAEKISVNLDNLDATPEEETKDPNLSLAVLGGAVGAAVGGAIWYFVAILANLQIGYIALALGYLIGWGVYLGAGKKRGQKLQIISAILALLAIIITEKFIYQYFLNDYIATNPSEFPDPAPGTEISVSFLDPYFWQSLGDPVSLIIFGLGIYIAYNFCKPREAKVVATE